MPEHPVEIRLIIPGSPDFLRLARLAAADAGSRAGLTFDEIEDLRIAVDELCHSVMRADGSDERILTSSYLDEGPTWAPNGRVLMFFRQARGAGVSLHQVDITGRFERQVPTPTDASDPAWSPLIPQ